MPAWIYKSVLVAVTLACVLVVFVAPTIDLPASALRASQSAHNLMACITFVGLLALFSLVLILFISGTEIVVAHPCGKTAPVLCTFLC